MSSRRGLEWTAAAGLAGWAAARLAAADRLDRAAAWVVPPLSFTPQLTAAAWASVPLIRGKGPRATAVLAGTALTVMLAPRAVPRRPQPAAGLRLRVLTANLLLGRAAPGRVVELVRGTGAEVLFLQELTDGAVTGLGRAGLDTLLPHRRIRPARGPYGTGIYARYPLGAGLPVEPATCARCTARLELPSGLSAQLVCVHLTPPKPLRPRLAARWRAEMAALPGPCGPAGPCGPGGTAVILAGDFNATLDHAGFRRLLRRGWLDAACQVGRGLAGTWGPGPHGRPALLAIDHVLVGRRCAVLAASLHRLAGSDHRAVYAEIRLPAPRDPRRDRAARLSRPLIAR